MKLKLFCRVDHEADKLSYAKLQKRFNDLLTWQKVALGILTDDQLDAKPPYGLSLRKRLKSLR
jgi:hypothetical protein